MNLFDIDDEIAAFFDRAIDPKTGEILDGTALDEIERLKSQREQTLFGCAALIKNNNADIESLKEHKRGIDSKIKALTNRVDSVRKYMGYNFKKDEKFKNEFHTIYTMKNSTLIVLAKPEDLPVEYQRILPVETKKKELKADIISGEYSGTGAKIERGFTVAIR